MNGDILYGIMVIVGAGIGYFVVCWLLGICIGWVVGLYHKYNNAKKPS